MKKSITSVISILLVILLGLSLAACGGGKKTDANSNAENQDNSSNGKDNASDIADNNGNDNGNENGNENEADDSTEYTRKDYSNEDPMPVSFTGIAWGNGAEKGGLVEQEFDKMLNLDIDVTWIPYADYTERLNMMMVSKNLTDVTQIMAVNDKSFYPQVVQAIRNGLFKDLRPHVMDSGFKDENEIMKNWPDTIWENCTFEDGLYLLPRGYQDLDTQSTVYYRKDIFEKTDLEIPTNVDDLADFIIAMGEAAGSDMYGITCSDSDFNSTFKMVANAFTGVENWHVDDEGNFTFQSFMPEYKDFLSWTKKLYDEGAMDPEFILDQKTTSSFEDGKSAVRFKNWRDWNQSGDLVSNKWFASAVEESASVWAFGPVEGPKAPTVSVGGGSGYGQVVMINSNFPDEDMDRLLWSICRDDEEYLWFLHYGLEDVHYTMVDGQPAQVNEEQKEERSKGYVGGWNQIFLDQDPDYVNSKFVRAYSSEEMIDDAVKIHEAGLKAIDDYGIANVTLTLNSETYNSKWGNLTNDLVNNRAKVVMGEMSLEDWDKYVESVVNSKDYQAVCEEFKEQYLANQ